MLLEQWQWNEITMKVLEHIVDVIIRQQVDIDSI